MARRTKKNTAPTPEQLRQMYPYLYDYIIKRLYAYQNAFKAADDVLRAVNEKSFENRFKPFDYWAYDYAVEVIDNLDPKNYKL